MRNLFTKKWWLIASITACALIANHLLLDYVSKSVAYSKVHWLLYQEPAPVQTIIIGSSAGACGILPSQYTNLTKTSCYNLSETGAAYAEQELILNLYLSRHQVQQVLLQVDPWGITNVGYSYPFHEYNYLPYLDNAEIASSIYNNYGSLKFYCWKYCPMLKYAQFNTQIGISQFGTILTNNRYQPNPEQTNQAYMNDQELQKSQQAWTNMKYELEPTRIAALERMIQTAQSKGCQVTLCMAPVYHLCRLPDENRILSFYQELVAKYNTTLMIVDDEELLTNRIYFKDATHLNQKGAERWTQFLAEKMRKEVSSTN